MLNSVKLLILKKIIIKRLIDLLFAAIYRMPQFFFITQSIRECSLQKKMGEWEFELWTSLLECEDKMD